MYKFLENFNSTALWLFTSRKFLNEATNCIPSQSLNLILSHHSKRTIPYLRKIRTKIKRDPFFHDFRRQMKTLFQQVNTKNTIIGNHFKFMILVLFLRLYTILKSCKQSFRLKSPPLSNQNSFESVHLFPSSCHYLSDHTDVVHYAKQIIDNYLNTFVSIFKLNGVCNNVLPHFEEHNRVRRNILNYTVKSRIPVTIEERTSSYVDNAYQEALIANFLANSLPDLKFSPVMVEDAYEKSVSTSTKSYEIVNVNSFPLPQPAATLQSSTVVTASPLPPVRWNIQSTTQLYPVPLISSKPKPYKPPPTVTIEEPVSLGSHHHISTPSGSSQIISNLNWYQPVSNPSSWNLHNPNYPQYPSSNDDIYLHFPYPTISSQTNFTFLPDKLPNHEEPIFVEPIVVSSVDQLPINYPIPMENASLSHNPITVITGSRPPEIVILEDTFQTDVTADEEPAGTTATGEATVPVAADPPAAAGSSSAIGPAAAAAAAAGLGAAGAAAAAAGVAGAAGGVAGVGAGAAGLAAAAGVGGGGAAADEIGAEADIGGGVDLQVRPTDAIAYAPAGDEETGLETVFTDVSEFFVWFLSFGFVRSTLSAFYTLVLPHISFLLTSGFTVLAFLFPWLYPHVLVPLTSLLSSLVARDMDNG